MATQDQTVLTPAFTITVDGVDLPLAARGDVATIFVDDALDAAGTLALELNNWDMAAQTVSWSDSEQFEPGKSIEVQLGYTDRVATVFSGEITGLELSFPPDVRSRVVVRAYDRFHRLRAAAKQELLAGQGQRRGKPGRFTTQPDCRRGGQRRGASLSPSGQPDRR